MLDHLKLHQHDDDKDYNDEGKKEVFECEYASRSVSGPRIADTWSVIGAVVLYRNTFCMICQYLLDVCIYIYSMINALYEKVSTDQSNLQHPYRLGLAHCGRDSESDQGDVEEEMD